MTVTAHRRPLAELLDAALAELQTNPTISSYQFIDGVEIRGVSWDERIQTVLNTALEMLCDLIGIDFTTIKDAGDETERMIREAM